MNVFQPTPKSAHAAKLEAIRRERDPIVQAWAIKALIPQPSNKHTDDASIAADKLVATLRRR
jgi:hypothetical protein